MAVFFDPPSDELFVIAGPCVLESRELALEMAISLKNIGDDLNIVIVFKGSFDKANRTSSDSYRGPGIEEGLRILEEVKRTTGLPTLTDFHEVAQASAVADVVDIIQIPALLSKQTDMLIAASRTGKTVQIKKGQSCQASDMKHAVEKITRSGIPGSTPKERVILCERGNSFGYGQLIVDMTNLIKMRETGCPIVFDASHSCKMVNQQASDSLLLPMAKAAVACGISGLFLETHPRPEEALCDAVCSWPLNNLKHALEELIQIDHCVRSQKHMRPTEETAQL